MGTRVFVFGFWLDTDFLLVPPMAFSVIFFFHGIIATRLAVKKQKQKKGNENEIKNRVDGAARGPIWLALSNKTRKKKIGPIGWKRISTETRRVTGDRHSVEVRPRADFLFLSFICVLLLLMLMLMLLLLLNAGPFYGDVWQWNHRSFRFSAEPPNIPRALVFYEPAFFSFLFFFFFYRVLPGFSFLFSPLAAHNVQSRLLRPAFRFFFFDFFVVAVVAGVVAFFLFFPSIHFSRNVDRRRPLNRPLNGGRWWRDFEFYWRRKERMRRIDRKTLIRARSENDSMRTANQKERTAQKRITI